MGPRVNKTQYYYSADGTQQCTHRCVYCLTVTTEVFLAIDGNKHRDSQLDNLHKIREFSALSPKEDGFIEPLPSRPRDLLGEVVERLYKAEVVEDFKEIVSSRHSSTDTQRTQKTMTAHTRPAQVQT